MQRDNEYIRELLFEIEQQDDCWILVIRTLNDSNQDKRKWYHIQLLCDDGCLIEINDSAYRLTSQGHDFIESIRDNGIWEKTKNVVAESGGNATFEIVKALAYAFLRKKIYDHSGVEL